MFFNMQDVLQHDYFLNFCVSERGAGKTYSSLKYCIQRFIDCGEQFIYLRRMQTELDMACPTMFDAVKLDESFEGLQLYVKNDCMMCNQKCMGRVISISTAHKLKSTAFPHVKTIIFDEFISESGKYLKDEVTKFLSTVETIARMRDINIICLANQNTIYNPYYLYFKIKPHSKESKLTRFSKQSVLIYQFNGVEFRETKSKTRFAKLIKDTKYGSFILDNESIDDDYSFVDTLKGIRKTPIANIVLEGKNIVVYDVIFDSGFYLYFSIKEPHDDCRTLNFDKVLREGSTIESIRSFPICRRISIYIKRGDVRFKDIPTKNLIQGFIF